MEKASFFCTLLLFCSMVAGCAMPPNQAKLIRSSEVDQLVESGTVLPDYNYYFTGPEARPDAIIAIANRFSLQSKYWIKVENVAVQLHDWNRIIDNSHRYRYRYRYEGSWIMTPDGEKAGLWYSRYDNNLIRFPDASSIIVYTPFIPLDPNPFFFKRP